jgi:hypothetical protein
MVADSLIYELESAKFGQSEEEQEKRFFKCRRRGLVSKLIFAQNYS